MNLINLGITELSLRHLKAVRCVHDLGTVSKAAEHLNRSQTAITLAIKDIEHSLELTLFNRTSTGMRPTIYGKTLYKRILLMEQEFTQAKKEYERITNELPHPVPSPIFSFEVSYKRLAVLLALQRTNDISKAARLLGVSQTAIYKSLNELETLLDIKLFERYSSGINLTHYCLVLVQHINLAFTHLRHALDELKNQDGIVSGRVAIGMLPYSRTVLSPRAITLLLNEYPQLKISAREGTYAQLAPSLKNGDLDMIVGATRPAGEEKGFTNEYLFSDRLAFIVRADHPLLGTKKLSLGDINHLEWILPARNTPSRQLFDHLLEKQGLQQPTNYIETSSLTALRGILLESDRVALLSTHQVYYEMKHGLLKSLPIELQETYRPIGVTLRKNFLPTPGIRLLLDKLHAVAQELKKSDRQLT